MKFSVFTVGTPDYNIEETIKELRKYGYHGVEWRVGASLKGEPAVIPPKDGWYWSYNKSTVEEDTILDEAEKIKALCKAGGIEISALATYIPSSSPERVERALKAAAAMNCTKIRVCVPQYKGDMNYRELFQKTVKEFEVLEDLARKYDVKINFEIHHGTITSSASSAYRLASNFNSKYIGVIYDPGNMVHEGYEDYKMGLELLGEYLDHVHIKNAAWFLMKNKETGKEAWECSWSPLRNGQVDFVKLLSALQYVNYEGYLSFEDFSNEESTEDKLKDNIAFIKELLSQV